MSDKELEAWNKIAADLEGSTRHLDDVLADHKAESLEDDMRFLSWLDDQMFSCANCGWWCPIDEVNEWNGTDWVCDDCV